MSPATIGWIFVIAGAILVAVGGSSATYGWNKIRTYDQSRNAAIGVVREFALNDRLIESAKALARRWPTRSMNDAFPYEALYNDHVLSLVTSGALDPNSPSDREVLDALEAYQREVARFNASLRIVGRTNPGIFIRVELIPVTDPQAWPAVPTDTFAEPFLKLIGAHERAQVALQEKYPWATVKYLK